MSGYVVDDLVEADLARIGWSGSPLHVSNVGQELERVARGDAAYLVVRAPDGAPIAKCGIRFDSVPDAGEIHQLATHPDLQGHGIGTMLITAAENRIRSRGFPDAFLSVEQDNPRARALYERLGYVERGTRSSSWEAQRPDGTVFLYETELVDMRKSLQ